MADLASGLPFCHSVPRFIVLRISLDDGGMAITRPSKWLGISPNVKKVVIKDGSLPPVPRLLGLGRTDRTFELIVEHIGQIERVSFVRFEQPLWPLLNMDDVHRNAAILQILH